MWQSACLTGTTIDINGGSHIHQQPSEALAGFCDVHSDPAGRFRAVPFDGAAAG